MMELSRAAFLLKVIVTAIILSIVLKNIDFSTVGNSLSHIKLPFLFAGIAIESPLLITGVQRWRVVARTFGERLALRPALVYMLIAVFINLGFPSILGLDAARTWKLRRHVQSFNLAARIVFMDRLCAFVSLLLIIGIGLPLSSKLDNAALFMNVTIVFVLSAAVGLVLISSFRYFEKIIPTTFGMKYLYQISSDINNIFLNNKSALAQILLWGGANHLIRVALVYFVALSLSLDLSPMDAFILAPIALLISMIPISLGGWGVREAAFIMMFGLAGIAPASALALSVLYGLIVSITALIGGAVWIAEQRLSQGPAMAMEGQ